MKYTLILSLLIISLCSKGQHYDSVWTNSNIDTLFARHGGIIKAIALNKPEVDTFDYPTHWDTALAAIGLTTGTVSAVLPYTRSAPEYDTIKVQLLVSSESVENNKVIKLIGYEVRKKYRDGFYINAPDMYTHIKYFDIVKQELPGNLIVWMAKEIK